MRLGTCRMAPPPHTIACTRTHSGKPLGSGTSMCGLMRRSESGQAHHGNGSHNEYRAANPQCEMIGTRSLLHSRDKDRTESEAERECSEKHPVQATVVPKPEVARGEIADHIAFRAMRESDEERTGRRGIGSKKRKPRNTEGCQHHDERRDPWCEEPV